MSWKSKSVAIGALLCVVALAADRAPWRVHSLKSLEYPPIAASARLEGTVELALDIGRDGSVRKVTVRSGHSLLAEAAETNAKEWRFDPPSEGADQPSIECCKMIYTFRIVGDCEAQRCPTIFSFEAPDHVTVETKAPHWQR